MSTIRAYNPGSKIMQDRFSYDHPTNDPRNQNLIAYWTFDAPAESFFDIPTEQIVETVNGPQAVPVRFADRIRKEYRDYGIVLIDPKAKNLNPDDNLARDDKEAKEKGDRFWRAYLETKAREHIDNVNQAKAFNVPPKRAHGIYSHALKVLSLTDPADPVGNMVESTRNTADFGALQAQLVAMQAQIERLTARKQ
jgi:hypothetical protein